MAARPAAVAALCAVASAATVIAVAGRSGGIRTPGWVVPAAVAWGPGWLAGALAALGLRRAGPAARLVAIGAVLPLLILPPAPASLLADAGVAGGVTAAFLIARPRRMTAGRMAALSLAGASPASVLVRVALPALWMDLAGAAAAACLALLWRGIAGPSPWPGTLLAILLALLAALQAAASARSSADGAMPFR